MARDFQIFGECLVSVRGGQHLSGGAIADWSELGLAVDSIRVIPNFRHWDIRATDFGSDIPAEVMSVMADCNIRINLIHYDADVLDICFAETMGGAIAAKPLFGGDWLPAGVLAPAGTLMGGGAKVLSSGCHFISLNIANFAGDESPYQFPAAYLTQPPVEIPIGTNATLAQLNFRAIPYTTPGGGGIPPFAGEVISSGAFLWLRKAVYSGNVDVNGSPR